MKKIKFITLVLITVAFSITSFSGCGRKAFVENIPETIETTKTIAEKTIEIEVESELTSQPSHSTMQFTKKVDKANQSSEEATETAESTSAMESLVAPTTAEKPVWTNPPTEAPTNAPPVETASPATPAPTSPPTEASTAAPTPEPTTPAPPPVEEVQILPAGSVFCTAVFNKINDIKVADGYPVAAWSDTLAANAQVWAETIAREKDIRHEGGLFVESIGNGYGTSADSGVYAGDVLGFHQYSLVSECVTIGVGGAYRSDGVGGTYCVVRGRK